MNVAAARPPAGELGGRAYVRAGGPRAAEAPRLVRITALHARLVRDAGGGLVARRDVVRDHA